jgi:hypothetical protein
MPDIYFVDTVRCTEIRYLAFEKVRGVSDRIRVLEIGR